MDKTLRYNGRVVAKRIVYCNDILKKGTGLMFRSRNALKDKAWLFPFKRPRRVCITMILVFYPIDIIFLDNRNRIIELKEDIRPFQNYTSKEKIYSFLELSKGSIRKFKIKEGNFLKIK